MRAQTAEKLSSQADLYWNYITHNQCGGGGEKTPYFMSLREVAHEMDLTPERVRQIEKKALSKLRHPKRSKLLLPFLEKNFNLDQILKK